MILRTMPHSGQAITQGWILGTGTLLGFTVPMVGMADGMIPGTTIVFGRGMIRSSGTMATGATLLGTDITVAIILMATMAIIPTVIMVLAIIPTAIMTTIPIIMHMEVAADTTTPTMAILVPSTATVVHMDALPVTAQWPVVQHPHARRRV